MPIKTVLVFLSLTWILPVLTGCDKPEPAQQAALPAAQDTGPAAQALPPPTAMRVDGTQMDIGEIEAEWLVVNFWAVWCGPCRDEIPELNELDRIEDVQVLGVDFDGQQGAALQQAMSELKIEFPVLPAPTIRGVELPQPPVLPVTYLIREESLVATLQGPQTVSSIESALEEAGRTAQQNQSGSAE